MAVWGVSLMQEFQGQGSFFMGCFDLTGDYAMAKIPFGIGALISSLRRAGLVGKKESNEASGSKSLEDLSAKESEYFFEHLNRIQGILSD